MDNLSISIADKEKKADNSGIDIVEKNGGANNSDSGKADNNADKKIKDLDTKIVDANKANNPGIDTNKRADR